MTPDAEVFIIGAGPAGLTAAYCLTKETPSVIVIEKDPVYVGGISRTVKYKDFLFDIGGHRFFSKAKEVVDLWHEILPDDFIARPRLSRIFYGGKYYSYPLSAFEALRNLGVFTSASCMISYAKARLKPIEDPRSFHHWVRNQFGEKLFRIFFKTYTEKVWGMSCDDISADWAAQRIKGLDLSVAVRHALKRSLGRKAKTSANGDVVKTLIETFQYPRKGPGMMWDAAAKKNPRPRRPPADGTRAAKPVLRRNRKAVAHRGRGRRDNRNFHRASCREFRAGARTRRQAQSASDLNLSRARVALPRFSHRRADGEKAGAVSRQLDLYPRSCREGRACAELPFMVAGNGARRHELLGLEYFCFEGDGCGTRADADLIALAKKEIAQIGLVTEQDIVDGCVVRQHKAYPIYDDEYRHNMAMIRLDLETHYPTLHLVGRNGMHKYNNQDHAMMTAMLTARNILADARIHDVWDVNEDAEYHEAGASGARAALASERAVPQKIADEQAA